MNKGCCWGPRGRAPQVYIWNLEWVRADIIFKVGPLPVLLWDLPNIESVPIEGVQSTKIFPFVVNIGIVQNPFVHTFYHTWVRGPIVVCHVVLLPMCRLHHTPDSEDTLVTWSHMNRQIDHITILYNDNTLIYLVFFSNIIPPCSSCILALILWV